MKWWVLYVVLTTAVGAETVTRYDLVDGWTEFPVPRFASKKDCVQAATDLVGSLTRAGFTVSTTCKEE